MVVFTEQQKYSEIYNDIYKKIQHFIAGQGLYNTCIRKIQDLNKYKLFTLRYPHIYIASIDANTEMLVVIITEYVIIVDETDINTLSEQIENNTYVFVFLNNLTINIVTPILMPHPWPGERAYCMSDNYLDLEYNILVDGINKTKREIMTNVAHADVSTLYCNDSSLPDVRKKVDCHYFKMINISSMTNYYITFDDDKLVIEGKCCADDFCIDAYIFNIIDNKFIYCFSPPAE